jgi:hypothetical protein
MSIVQRRARALVAPLLAAVLVVGAGVLAAPLAACTGDDPVITTSSSGGAGADASAEGSTDAAIATAAAGDVVFLSGDAIKLGNDGNISEWPSSVSGVVARPASAAPPTPTQLPGGQVCAAFSGAVDPLVIGASDAIATPGDYSVTVVLKRGAKQDASKFYGRVAVGRVTFFTDRVYGGFALMSEHQDAQGFITSSKYAARLSVNYDTSSAVEAVEPSVRDDKLHVVVLQRAGDNVQLRIDNERFGPSIGASAVVVPSSQPIVIGGLLNATGDVVGIFTGAICTVIVHAGPEADTAITSRIAALRAQYGI